MEAAIQYILYFAVLVVLAVPLGRFMAHIMDGEHTFLSPVIAPVERGVYRLLRIDAAEQMGCRRFSLSCQAILNTCRVCHGTCRLIRLLPS